MHLNAFNALYLKYEILMLYWFDKHCIELSQLSTLHLKANKKIRKRLIRFIMINKNKKFSGLN